MKQTNVMKATLGRLPSYLEFLKGLAPDEYVNISATVIAKSLGLGEVQVRKDLNSVSGAGRPKLGYDKRALIKRLEEILCPTANSHAVIVGAGKLGHALLEYTGFSNYGLTVSAAFDNNKSLIGRTSSGKEILPIESISEYCKSQNVRIGIITVPSSAAQEICDLLLDCGITAIWNFAPCALSVPDGVILQQENLALSLAHLKTQMK